MSGRASEQANETWVALLRAVNLGGRNRVPMEELRRVVEAAGSTDVRTYIASGNVVFRHESADRSTLAQTLEARVETAFGVKSSVILRTGSELRNVASAEPFGAGTPPSHVTFLAADPDPARLRRLEELDVAPDQFRVTGPDVFLHYPNGVQGSKLTNALVERVLGVAATNRTARTVARLAEMAAEAAGEPTA